MDNHVLIAGLVESEPQTRYSPAGIPIARLFIRHESVQSEAGMQRKAECRIPVVASGEALQPIVRQLKCEQFVRIGGFLDKASYRSGSENLELHAETIELLATPPTAIREID
jgi:primosomal replication protein N